MRGIYYINWNVCIFVILLYAPAFVTADHAHEGDLSYWLPEEVNDPLMANAFQRIVSLPSQKIDIKQASPIRIALIYPSKDVSDFWVKNHLAMTRRLDELGIDYSIDEFISEQIEHALQSKYVDQVLSESNKYDVVIFGPSELSTQAQNVQRLAESTNFDTFIWAFHTPFKKWSVQPAMWLDFSGATGAVALCDYALERFGANKTFALNRGIPGITDSHRSGEFKSCVEQKGDWLNVYEHFGQYLSEGGADGADLVAKYFPQVDLLHNANTAMATGAVEALAKQGLRSHNIHVTGWGGTGIELQLIRDKKLHATPMRMGDDVGVASAEAIKYLLQGKRESLPHIYLGRIVVAHEGMTEEQLNRLEKEAFRYSGMGTVER